MDGTNQNDQLEWQLAAKWLADANILPFDNKVFTDEAQVFDLVQVLRDGVLLCCLARRLDPQAIPDFGTISKHSSQFRCKTNIKMFLTACKERFRIHNKDLFTADELLHITDFAKVIHTLSVLSKSKAAEQLHLKPFDDNQKVTTEENIYANLGDLAETTDIADREPIYDAVYDNVDEKIYDALIPRWEEKSTSVSFAPKKEKRMYVFEELCNTEAHYVAYLRIIVKFVDAVESVISPHDSSAIFINIKDLLIAHEKFLDRLLASKRNGGLEISACFQAIRNDLFHYGEYCSKYLNAINKLDEMIQKRPDFKIIVDAVADSTDNEMSNKGFSLKELLILPMQRVLRYPLLVSELVKSTKSTHSDYTKLQNTLMVLQDIARCINEIKRDNEDLAVLEHLSSSIVRGQDQSLPQDVFQLGRLIADGDLSIKLIDDNKKTQKSRYCFLFDFALLICKKNNNDTYTLKHVLWTNECTIEEPKPQGTRSKKHLVIWYMLSSNEKRGQETWLFQAKNDGEKKKWLGFFEKARAFVAPDDATKGSHQFQYCTVPVSAVCEYCGKVLWGRVYQGYKCKNCNVMSHKDCLSKASLCSQAVSENRIDRRLPGSRSLMALPEVPSQSRSRSAGSLSRIRDIQSRPIPEPPSEENSETARRMKLLEKYDWFVGKKGRNEVDFSETEEDGIFVVRESERRVGELTLDIQFKGVVKHIKIMQDNNEFYLVAVNRFETLPKMIEYYKSISLSESFPELLTKLTMSLSEAKYRKNSARIKPSPVFAIARYNFEAESEHELSLKVHDKIRITSTACKDVGWLHGECKGKVGFFPVKYVDVQQSDDDRSS